MATEKDPLVEVNRRAMEHIWGSVPKEIKNSVEYIVYTASDIPFLYSSGLVDTARYSLDQWKKAFDDCLGEDGRYWVSHEKMLALGRFRYCKTVNEPFDPLKMRQGKYTVERLWQVYERSIIPSCALPQEFFKNSFDQLIRQQKNPQDYYAAEIAELKKKGEEVDAKKFSSMNFETIDGQGYVTITEEHLIKLKQALDAFPSPRRRLEQSVQDLRRSKLQQLADIAQNPQKSAFESGKDFRETAKQSLKEMLVKASENVTAGRKPTDEVLDLKALQKNKRPTKF